MIIRIIFQTPEPTLQVCAWAANWREVRHHLRSAKRNQDTLICIDRYQTLRARNF